jgi:hypothetical protein
MEARPARRVVVAAAKRLDEVVPERGALAKAIGSATTDGQEM